MSRISSAVNPAGLRWPLVYLGVAFTTLGTLLLELALTRIFSVVFYYHMAFLAISVAMFGLGAGGVLSYLIVAPDGRIFRRAGELALLSSGAVIAALVLLLTRQTAPSGQMLFVVYAVCAAPFIIAGAILSLVIAETISRVDRVYFSDLTGAAGGCLLLIPLLDSVGGPNTVLAAASIFGVSGAIWFSLVGSVRGRVIAVGAALGLVGLLIYNQRFGIIDIRFAKGEQLRRERFVKWNSFSRVALRSERDAPGRMEIVIDADASTGIPRYDYDNLTDRERRALLHEGPGLPYVMRPGARTLIIGPGGGWDVARAIAGGSRDITGVEINRIIARTIMQERFPDLSRRLYFRPEVKIHVDDGRSFVRRSRDRYQVIQLTLVDTWAATAAGAFSLSENNLYTTEAFREYLHHLTPDGLVAFTRWGFEPPRESLRLVTLAIDALTTIGEKQPWRHVIVAREGLENLRTWGSRDTVLISRQPFNDADIVRFRLLLRQGVMQGVYVPGDTTGSAFASLLRARDPNRFLDEYPYDVTPVDDNRPFFFYTVQPRDVAAFFMQWSRDSADFKINSAVPLLFGVFGASLFATAIMLALPPVVLGSRLPSQPGVRRFLLYFIFIGAGFILIQMSLIQRFVLLLGHPTYALTVIIFSMLIWSGLGSYFSRRVVQFADNRLRLVLAWIAVLAAVMAFALPWLASAAMAWPLALRATISVLLIAPLGFAMGMPFPSGLARLEERHKPSVRWAWSLNAAASVLGSATAIFLAIYLGLRETMLIGAAMYAAAFVSVRGRPGP